MVPAWYRDGQYPEDATPKCSFLTTCSPCFFAQMRIPFLKPPVFLPHEVLGRDYRLTLMTATLPSPAATRSSQPGLEPSAVSRYRYLYAFGPVYNQVTGSGAGSPAHRTGTFAPGGGWGASAAGHDWPGRQPHPGFA